MAISKKDLERSRANLAKLGLSPEEIEDVIRCDLEIDAGGDPFALSAEQAKVEKKMRRAERKIVEVVKREKKIDTAKESILSKIATLLGEGAVIVNPNKELTFGQYSVNLTKRRKFVEPVAAPETSSKKKSDAEKAEIIARMANLFGECAVVTNREREISLQMLDAQYSITLIKHRK